MTHKIFLILIISMFSLNVFAQKNNWRKQIEKIKSLTTSENEVEKILGKAVERYADVAEYETKEGLFSVTYSQGLIL
jgi:hypothetical protein